MAAFFPLSPAPNKVCADWTVSAQKEGDYNPMSWPSAPAQHPLLAVSPPGTFV